MLVVVREVYEEQSEDADGEGDASEERDEDGVVSAHLGVVLLQNLLGLNRVVVGKVLREEYLKIRYDVKNFLSVGERLFVDESLDFFVYDVVFHDEEFLSKFFEDLLDCQVVYLRISIQPLQVLVDFDEGSPPIGGKLELILGPVDFFRVDNLLVLLDIISLVYRSKITCW